MINKIYLGLGSNLGNKRSNLEQAIEYIKKRIGSEIEQSAFYATESWGFTSSNTFLNAVVSCNTSLSPEEVLYITQNIEKDMGRNRKSIGRDYTDRIIDIDILLWNRDIIQKPELIVPHPLMHKRLFVLRPLANLAPNAWHPTLKRNARQLLEQLIREEESTQK